MKFIKNLILIFVLSVVIFGTCLSMIPSEWVAYHIWPIMLPFYFIVGAYCLTYKTTPDKIIEKLFKN